SEDTARRIDAAVSDILNGEYQRAEQIINDHRSALDKIAQALLEHETIEGKHVLEIVQHGEIRSPITPTPRPARDGSAPTPRATPASESPGGAATPAPTPA